MSCPTALCDAQSPVAPCAGEDAVRAFLAWLQSSDRSGKFVRRATIIVAHPDDEVIGIGAHLYRLSDLTIVYCTDGSPRNLSDAARAGCSTREAYAALRRREVDAALRLVGHAGAAVRLPFIDQQASCHLVDLTREIHSCLASIRPEVVLTHPYEGGHPDHDSVAFAVHGAVACLAREGELAPALIEMSSYHNNRGSMSVARFLPAPGVAEVAVVLSEAEQRLKQQLFECFPSQALTLSAFARNLECFRPAPHYDFRQAPHPGALYYELFDWGMTGARWREHAALALAQLEPCRV